MKIKQTCKCGKNFLAKESDIKRGWGRSCSKSCSKVGNINRIKRFIKSNNKNNILFDEICIHEHDTNIFMINNNDYEYYDSMSDYYGDDGGGYYLSKESK